MTEGPTVPSYPDLRGKVAVVTGGSGGIGGATCRLLAVNGVKVAVNGRNEANIDAVVRDIRAAGGTAIAAPADGTDFGAVEAMRRQVEQALGRLGTPEDIALATLFLVSESASWLTGVTLDITGGLVAP